MILSRKRIWLYAAILFILTATVLATQVSWILQSAKIEESFLSQRVNMALCSAMDVLSKDRALCSNVASCESQGQGTFRISFNSQEKQKIDSVINRHLLFYNINVPFNTTLTPFISQGPKSSLSQDQALLYPEKEGMQNVLVRIEIPSKSDLIRSQINGFFILSIVVLMLLIWVFGHTLRSLYRERQIRSETVDYINTMAHDLKTPISNISLAAALLARDSQNRNETPNQYISIINDETAKLKERAGRILGAASVDAILEDSSDKNAVDVHDIIDRCIQSFSLKLFETKGEISKKLEATRSIVTGSQLQLSSAVMNIIDNAITYSQGPLNIRITTRNEGNGVSIEIRDNGPGIATTEQALVFKKAYRIRDGRKIPEGFGLGLYLSKTLVERHGGKLSLSSDGLTGSCFRIQLPTL
jgi:signal transduction histidine kinase